MEFTIAHNTAYYYETPVKESYTVLHLQPRSDTNQFCTKYALRVSPVASIHRYVDRFANNVEHFEILPGHSSLSITATSLVVTTIPSPVAEPTAATRDLLDADPATPELYDYIHSSAFVQFTPELEQFLWELPSPGEHIGQWCLQVSHAIKAGFVYDKSATTVRSTIAESLRLRAGVCQDFTHIMIAVLRAAGIPARYVSGYIFGGDRVLGAEASHAWCEAYLPPYGWFGIDPTNDRLIDDQFVKIAIGRDYGDVSPVRGVYKGSSEGLLSVNVEMEVLGSQQQQQQ
ncbi:MAG TPA: transglutaminase family protein [Candidatus Acidoferrales bacterium]|nr:transglutaminase family protein [Candidatus Acidoferrales bacterium]